MAATLGSPMYTGYNRPLGQTGGVAAAAARHESAAASTRRTDVACTAPNIADPCRLGSGSYVKNICIYIYTIARKSSCMDEEEVGLEDHHQQQQPPFCIYISTRIRALEE